jgi:hypothetical protein
MKGQVTALSLLLIPLFIIIVGLILRSGNTALTHQKIQRYADTKTLDLLNIQAKALQALGALNSFAQTTIDMRRQVDLALKTPLVLNPAALEGLMMTKKTLEIIQRKNDFQQKQIMLTAKTLLLSQSKMPLPPDWREKAKIEIKTPLTFSVTPKATYKGEVGAPFEKEFDFDQKQVVETQITVRTESFLSSWPGFKPLPAMEIKSKGQIFISQLEDSWTARLIPINIIKP